MSLLPKECTICGKNYCEHQIHQMTNLPEKDLSLIEQIQKDIGTLKKVLDYEFGEVDGVSRFKHLWGKYAKLTDSKPIVEPKEDNQQKEVWKPEVGMWFKSEVGNLYLCDYIGSNIISGNNQNGSYYYRNIEVPTTKPTKEQVEAHLVEIANVKGYKTGVKIISIVDWHTPKEVKIKYNDGLLIDGFKMSSWAFCLNGFAIWNKYKGWATIVNEVEQERWKVNIMDTVSGHCAIYITRNPPLRKLKAEEIAEEIKQYLSKK